MSENKTLPYFTQKAAIKRPFSLPYKQRAPLWNWI